MNCPKCGSPRHETEARRRVVVEMKPNTIHYGDCLDLMGDIDDGSIDMILADLPYQVTSCAWDTLIPLKPLWKHYKRIIKPRGAIALTAIQPFTTKLINAGGLDWFKYEWIWSKNVQSGIGTVKFKPMRSTEDILIFYKNAPTYNSQKVRSRVTDRPTGNPNGKFRAESSTDIVHIQGKLKKNNPHNILNHFVFPRNLLEIDVEPRALGTLHPTQKPVALFSYLVKTYTNPGDLVLDNVAGSGTTAISCIETGRNWLLIEKDPEYYQVAKKRIEERLRQPFLPGVVEEGEKVEQLGFDNLAEV